MRPLQLIFIFLITASQMLGQTPADWWYFGQGAGVHFTTSGPVPDANGQLTTSEGCASISDGAGNLLFYTDGITVYDKNHNTMPNGTGLAGDPSSTQSAVVVPRPGSQSDYYIFTVDDGAQVSGMQYSKVDMSLNSGLGDVVTSEKNIPLITPTAEKISSIKTQNAYWVVTLKIPGDTMYAYKVTSSGVNLTPVLSNTGVSLSASTFWGYLKPNVQGTQLGFISQGISEAFLFDFNATTGMVTGSTAINQSVGANSGYGIEFSPDGTLLYTMSYSTCDLKQYDITLGTTAAISASEQILGTNTSGGGALQTGPDGKLYISRAGMNHISALNYPNVYGTGAEFVDTAVVLSTGKTCVLGLPTFIQSFFNISFSVDATCIGDTTYLSVDTVDVDSVKWNFGDPSSGSLNTSTSFNTAHFYADTGFYEIRLIAYSDTNVDTSFQTMRVYPRQSIDLGPDTLLCTGTSLEFSAAQPFASFLWHDSTTADTFSTAGDTFIKVTVFGVCDTVSDSVNITYDDTITFELGPDTVLCGGNGFEIDGNLDPTNATVWWNTNDSTNTLLAIESGEYIMNAENACGSLSDTIEVSFIPIPNVSLLPNDTINCFDNEIVLTRPDEDSTTYIWSDSTTKKTYTVDTTEVVWLAAFNECGATVDTMRIFYNGEIISELGPDTTICSDDSIVLNAFSPGATYLWNTGDTADSVVTLSEGMLYVVTVSQGFCTTIESRQVELSPVFCPGIDCRLYTLNVFSPNGDGLNDIWRVRIDCDIYEYDLRIYNRWGQLVHQSSNSNFGWDGTINGEFAPDGVYYYDVQYKDNVAVDVDRFSYRGSLTLYR